MTFNSLHSILLREKNWYKTLLKKVFEHDILPEYKILEQSRIREFNKFLLAIGCSILLLIVTIIGTVKISNEFGSEVIAIVGTIAVLLGLSYSLFINYCFVSNIKAQCMKKLIVALGDITWKQGSISKDDIVASQLFPLFSNKTSDDTLQGIHNGVQYTIDETLLTGSSGYTAFKGVIIKFNFNKNFTGKTIITDKSNFNKTFKNFECFILYFTLCAALFVLGVATFFTKNILIICLGLCLLYIYGYFANELIKNNKEMSTDEFENLTEIQLEDVTFEKKYSAYSSDQVEGRYLLTTAFMLRFQNLQQAFGNSKIKCSFYNNRLMFAISTNKNLFEIGYLHKPLTNFKIIENCLDEIISILIIIDYLKLNQSIML